MIFFLDVSNNIVEIQILYGVVLVTQNILLRNFLFRPHLPAHCRYRQWLVQFITFNDTHIRWDSPGRGIGLSQRSVPAQHTTFAHNRHPTPPSWIRTRSPMKGAAADLRPRPRGDWDQDIRIFRNLRLEFKRVRRVLNLVLLTGYVQC